MDKALQSTVAAAKEFFKLEILLIQTADETADCLKILKSNLGEYDKRHGLLFLNTSKSFVRRDIRFAKDTASELKHIAEQIAKSKHPSKGMIAVARRTVNEIFDALCELRTTARLYDRKNLNSGYGHGHESAEFEDNWLGTEKKSSKIKGSGSRETRKAIADTVEAVVKFTVHTHFSGFSTSKHQLMNAEESLSADRIMDTMASIWENCREITNFESEKRRRSA
ncbi:unnamed protein product [Peronospora farinosa]|uniref:Uncharacterized protein n=1 Tax=Peronospora farinosa TaxID=134698 RepID=A0AAV0UNW2_9STRA|nr:unnamed protein product [Peronospora farinosa]CAI5737290.1 unnamed protein product [Peronospora farinosa]